MSAVYLSLGMVWRVRIPMTVVLMMLILPPFMRARQIGDRISKPPDTDAILQTASRLIEEHELEKAESVLKPLLARHPGHADGMNLLGRIRIEQHRLDEAMTVFESVLKRESKNSAARVGEVKAGIASALEAKVAGDTDGALVYLVRARKYVPDDAELLFDFGVHADTMHLYKDAEEALTMSLKLRPNDPQTIYAIARVELDEQNLPQAEAHFRRYLGVHPEDASAHYGLGKLLRMAARDDEAQGELQRSIELQPQQTESYYELGSIDLELQNNEPAAALFEKVLQRNPRHGGALTGIGVIAYRAKDYSKAEKFLESAVRYAPDYSPAHFYYGTVLARLGRQREAEQELAQAKSLADKQNQEPRGYFLSTPKPPPD
jgi:tetratricopeptide (TPR) repeat protein